MKQIAVFGCGGVGSRYTELIAREIRTRKLSDTIFLFVDHDKVEDKNLNRQMFDKSDIGVHKAALCENIIYKILNEHHYQYIRKIESQIDCEGIFLNISSHKLAIIATDNIMSKVTIATWCDKKGIPYLIANCDKDFVEVIGIDADESISRGRAFQRKMNIRFRVVNDPTGAIIKLFDPHGMPSVYIIQYGEVVDVIFGAKDHIDRIIKSKIDTLLYF